MIVYIDSDFKCYVDQTPENSRRAVECNALNDKNRTYIEGMRYVPAGEAWTRADGKTFTGPMLAPWRNSQILSAAQSAYEDALAQLQPQVDDIFVALVEVE